MPRKRVSYPPLMSPYSALITFLMCVLTWLITTVSRREDTNRPRQDSPSDQIVVSKQLSIPSGFTRVAQYAQSLPPPPVALTEGDDTNAADSSVASLANRLYDVESSVADLQRLVRDDPSSTALRQDIVALRDYCQTLGKMVTTLASQQTADSINSAAADRLNQRMLDTNTRLDALSEMVDKHGANQKAIEGEVSKMSSTIESIRNDLAGISTYLRNVHAFITAQQAQIDALRQSLHQQGIATLPDSKVIQEEHP